LRSLADDEAGRAALGAAARERQRAEFSIASQLAGTEAVYRRAIQVRRQRRTGGDDSVGDAPADDATSERAGRRRSQATGRWWGR
jgi:hypothetical protein